MINTHLKISHILLQYITQHINVYGYTIVYRYLEYKMVGNADNNF